MTTGSASYHPPRRKPAQETLEKILVAAETQLREEELDSFTIQSVLQRAGLSVGAFYSRFPDKTALLHEVQERVHERVEARILTELAAIRERCVSLEDAVDQGFGILIHYVLGERTVFRAFMMLSVFDEHMRAKGERVNQERKRAVLEVLEPHLRELGDADPAPAFDAAFSIYLSTIRGRLVYYGSASEVRFGVTDDVLFRDLKRAVTAFLRSAIPAACSPALEREPGTGD